MGQTLFGMVSLPWLTSLPDSWDGLLGAGEGVSSIRKSTFAPWETMVAVACLASKT